MGLPQDGLRDAPDLTVTSLAALAQTVADLRRDALLNEQARACGAHPARIEIGCRHDAFERLIERHEERARIVEVGTHEYVFEPGLQALQLIGDYRSATPEPFGDPRA